MSRALDVERTGAQGHVHDVVGRPDLGEPLRRQGRHPVRSRRRRGGDGPHGHERGLQARHRLRHGRHLDRRRPLRRRVRARLRDGSRGRAHARADAEDPHRRRRRRLDPAFRRRAFPRRPGFGRRRPRPGLLPARRSAHRHRRQCDDRQAHPEFLPEGVRAERRSAAGRESRAGEIRRAGARGRRRAESRSRGGRLSRHRRREDGRGDQDDLRRARLRRHALRAQLLRRRRRPARLRRGGRAQRFDRADPPAVVAAFGLRHGPRRHRRPARQGGGRAARRRRASSRRPGRRRARRFGGRGGRGPGSRAARRSRRIAAAQLRYAGSDTTIEVALGFAAGDAAGVREGAQGTLRLRRPGEGDRHRGGVGRGGRRRGALR